MAPMTEEPIATQAVNLAEAMLVMGGFVAIALILYLLAGRALFRLRRADRFAQEASARARIAGLFTAMALGALMSLSFAEFQEGLDEILQQGLTIASIVGFTWWGIQIAIAVEATILSTMDLTGEDIPAGIRRRQTQVVLIRRLAIVSLVILAIGAILLTFDNARTLGTSVLASAGILGLVAGIAAQSTLGNVIAGVQIAVAEPMSIDDVVTVEGEWGNIEEVSLTYVVVRTWDRRRLVLPTSYFVNNPFVNWSRENSQVIGAVAWHLDHRTHVDLLREEFHRLVDDNPLWDGDIASLQVVDTTERTIVVRGVVTASDSTRAWNLRCGLREAVLAWLRDNHPESLPLTRLTEAPEPAPRPPRPLPEPVEARPGPGPDTEPDPDPSRTMELPVVPPTHHHPR
jgi:small-conductance mechanosensitive channel